ncbi:MAG: hypothetical protein SPI16_03555, partial [Porphyromonas sp.]|uniref:hypothetical protein n=1 Tax=Porphyromonas sp. TaxID=1924944 RepID=UPI002A91D79F
IHRKETKRECADLQIEILVCQKVGMQEKISIKYPTTATNLQPAESRKEGGDCTMSVILCIFAYFSE